MTTTLGRYSMRVAAAGACLLTGVALVGCGSSRDRAADAPGGVPRATATGTVAATPTGSPTATGRKSVGAGSSAASSSKLAKLPKGVSTARPKDPIAPKTVKPVKRNGKTVRPSVQVKANDKPFSQPIAYRDGLKLQITRMSRGKMTGQGPGKFADRAVTDFYVTLHNGTRKTVLTDAVVVTVTYGSPARVAHPVYDKKSIDFSGSIKPGHSARAVYGFSVPAAERANTTMTVDLDGTHQLAVFTGKVS